MYYVFKYLKAIEITKGSLTFLLLILCLGNWCLNLMFGETEKGCMCIPACALLLFNMNFRHAELP